MHYRRLFGVHTKTEILNRVAGESKPWTGTRKGVRVVIRRQGIRVRWRVCVSKIWVEGLADSVSDALLAIEEAAG